MNGESRDLVAEMRDCVRQLALLKVKINALFIEMTADQRDAAENDPEIQRLAETL